MSKSTIKSKTSRNSLVKIKEYIMREYMLLIYPDGDHLDSLSAEQKQQHLDKVIDYLQNLEKAGKLKGAQPLAPAGRQITGRKGTVTDGPFIETKESVAGYFHILAESDEDAINIAKANPLLDLDAGGRIEVRLIGTIDEV